MPNEHDIIQALRTLPVAVCITPRSDGYLWQCLSTSGFALTLAQAMTEGLTYPAHTFASDAIVVDDPVVIPAGSLN